MSREAPSTVFGTFSLAGPRFGDILHVGCRVRWGLGLGKSMKAKRPSATGRIDVDFIPSDTPIIGFTGALGSGCTFMAKAVADAYTYGHYELSAPIHEIAREKRRKESAQELQDIGNSLRKKYGADYLVRVAIEKASGDWKAGKTRPAIVFDSFRNTSEVDALRQWPNFYLVSVQASTGERQKRLLKDKRVVQDQAAFEAADRRDQQERLNYGQQVRLCNDLADIIIVNNEYVASVDKSEFARRKFARYVELIMGISKGKRPAESLPKPEERLMTMAYCASKGSSCLKRQVGALIGRESGEVLSTGCNDVPEGADSCLRDPELGSCAKDKIQEVIGAGFAHCPKCGRRISLKRLRCLECGKKIARFTKRCPACGKDPGIDYRCKCSTRVFSQFLPGASSSTGKLLDMCRAVHAEQNAILNLTKMGRPVPADAVLYTTTYPCNLCASLIVNVGIRKLVYAEPYVTKEAEKILDGKVETRPFEGVKSSAFFRLYR